MNGLGTWRRVAATILAVIAIAFAGQSAALATTEHCPPGGVKVEAAADELNDIVPAAGTLVCVKGSTDATGIVVADGTSTLVEILGNGHDVSYFVTYEEVQPSASPTPSSSSSPSASPTPTSTPPSPTPEPSASPSPSDPVGDTDPDPLPTMPPTDTASEDAPRTGNLAGFLLVWLVAASVGFGATYARVRNRK